MATCKPFQSHPDAPEDTPFLNGFHHVLRTRRLVAARRRCEWGDEPLVEADWKNENQFEKLGHVKSKLLTAG
jgi:hypothetical protein